ncbi:unnamed protein product [Rhizoctonia solani]|uniref:CN hydrolase domain-containing protein n=1 Tax=Rhizoctonia solani TaxID=456999 RepID=A0A8H3BJD7_9AGAM|nr:unnamed protein product [Rhizoctonia solani]
MNPPTIQTNNLSPHSAESTQIDRSMPATAVPPSSPSTGIPRLPSQNFDSPSLDISISAILATADTSDPAIAEKANKVKELSQENSELEQRLREIEQRLKAVEEKEKKRKSLQPGTALNSAKAPAAGEDFKVVFIGAGNIMFGSPEGPWNHSFRFEHKLGPRLKVVALIDPALDRASAALQKKRDSFVVSAYQDTKMYKTIDDFAKSMTPDDKPRAIIVGSPPHWRGSDLPGRDLELKLIKYFPGVAMFIEKPVSTGPYTTALNISKQIEAAGNICSVGYMLRYLKAVQMMKQIIEDKELVVMATSARYVCAYEAITKPDWWDKSRDQGPVIEQGTHFCDLSRYFGGDVDISSVMAHSVEWDEEPGHLSKLGIDENKIAPENRIPRVTTATWKYENGAVGTMTHAVALHGKNYSCELEVYLDGYQMRLVDPYHIPTLYIRRPGDDYEETYRFGDDDPFFSEAMFSANNIYSAASRYTRNMSNSAFEARNFRLSLVQLGGTGADKAANLAHAKEMVLKAAQPVDGKKTDLIVLPECFNSPYGHMHFPTYAETIGYKPGEPYDVSASKSESVKVLSEMAKETGKWLLGGSIPERDESDGKLYNTATVYNPQGELVAIHRKVHLFDIDIPGGITFKVGLVLPGRANHNNLDPRKVRHYREALSSLRLKPASYHVNFIRGLLIYRYLEFGKIGLGICYDVRFPEMAMIAAREGCVAMIYPGAFNLTTGPLHWELLQRARAVDNQMYVAMCSPARDMTAGYHAWGHSMVVDPMGKVISTTEHEEAIIHADIDPEMMRKTRSGIPVTVQRRFDVYPDVSA